jgi:hypothetical protein
VAGRWFSLVYSTNKTDLHNIAEIMLKVALNNIILTPLPKFHGAFDLNTHKWYA